MQTTQKHQNAKASQSSGRAVSGRLGLEKEPHAKQQAVERPKLGFKKNVFDLPRQLIGHPRPGGIVSPKTEHVDEQNTEQGNAAQNI